MTAPSPRCYLRHFEIFDETIVFQKKFLNVLRIKKANCISEELFTLYLIILIISFFLLLLSIAAENRVNRKKLFIWTTKSGGTQHHKHINCTWLFISNCNNASDILDWTWILHYFWLHKPTNTMSSSEESLKEKSHKPIGICSLFTRFNTQILTLCHRWHKRIHNPLKYLKSSVLQK